MHSNKDQFDKNYRDFFNNIPDSIFILDASANMVDVNDNCTELTGYSRKELISMNVKDFLLPDDKKHSAQYFKKLRNEGSYKGYIGRLKKKDGEIIVIEVNSSAIYDKKGVIVGSRDIIRDITDRIRMENALSESEYKFRTIIENSDAIIYMIQKDGTFALSEGKALKLLNLEPGQVVGSSVYDLYTEYPDILKSFQKALKGEHINLVVKVRDIYFQSFFSPFTNSEGEIFAVLGMAIDVSDRIRREEILEEARKKAEEADLLKSSFLANMSHEIRTPMNAILGFSALLAEQELDLPTRKRYSEIINDKGNELLTLLTDLIDISKIESGNVTVYPEEVLIKPLLQKQINQAQELINLGRVKQLKLITKDFEGLKDLLIKTDTLRFNQVMTNLIQNTLKFTEEGEIEISYHLENVGFATIFVRDTGIGIQQEKQELIFDRFRQIQENMRRDKGGTGLGLYISKTLVNLMGGEIWVESEPGKGSKFCFTMPLGVNKGN